VIQRAPGRRDLRLALIAQLAQDQKYAEAAAQHEALDKAQPNNPGMLRDWGALVLRDTSRPPGERKSAAAIWWKLREAKPHDAVTTAQAADPLRQAEVVDEALALYPTSKRREELALRLAIASGNLERARQAAERLFGLRLDTDTQVRLAGQMH
jgi:hypothetical protein